MKADTLIFDIGSVLVYLDFPEALKQMGLSGRARKKILEVPPIPGFWDALDRGDISRDEGARWFASYVPGDEEAAEYAIRHMTEYVNPIARNVRFLRRAKAAGCRVFYLSNFQKENWEILWGQRADFFSEFDGGVVSWEARCVKPDPAIYRMLMEQYSIVPQCALFIDDREANTQAARELGFQTITLPPGTDIFEKAAALGLRLTDTEK